MTDRGAIGSIAETLDVEWRSGVGGAQCDDCGRFTIVRAAGRDYMGEPTGWICRPCALGLIGDFDPQREGSADE